jgi:hypothetical protein
MAIARKNFKSSGALGTSASDLYTVPAATTAAVVAIQASNVDGSNDATVTVQWTDSSDSDAVTEFAYQVTVAAGDAVSIMAGLQYLEDGDKVQALASATGDIKISGSVIEYS